MKRILIVLCAAAFALPLLAENYDSSGFQAKISANGIVREISCGGKVLLTDGQIYGGYQLPPGEAKYDTRMIQRWDSRGRAAFERKGDMLTVHTKSTLGNKKYDKAVEYDATVVFTPDVITFRTRITGLVELKSHGSMFSRNFNISTALISGRGVRCIGTDGKAELRTIPAEYSKEFSLSGKEITFSLPGYLLTFSAGKNAAINSWDSRRWNVPLYSFRICDAQPWSSTLKTYPAGEVFEWEFRISIRKD